MPIARFAKNIVWGEAPIQTLRERAVRGGLFGKGGILTADLVPDAATRRSYRNFYKAMQEGDTGGMMSHGLGAGIGTAGYGANLAFNYGLPVYAAHEAYQAAKGKGEDPRRALGASLTSAAANVALAPVGAVQMLTTDPINKGIYKAWGANLDEGVQRAAQGSARYNRSSGRGAFSGDTNPMKDVRNLSRQRGVDPRQNMRYRQRQGTSPTQSAPTHYPKRAHLLRNMTPSE